MKPARRPPLEIARADGISARHLIAFLKTAHPDSVIILQSGSYRLLTRASLEGSPRENSPEVHLT